MTKRDAELFFELLAFRRVDRTWTQFFDRDLSTTVEHTFRVMWIALTLAKMEGVKNHEKVLKIALAHDVAESRTGDTHYLSRQYNKQNDKMAISDIFEKTIHQKEMIGLLDEYEKRKSLESKIVKDADNLDVELELREYADKGFKDALDKIKRRRERVRPILFTKSAKKLFDQIHKLDSACWHNNSPRTRFKAGDWKKAKKKGKEIE